MALEEGLSLSTTEKPSPRIESVIQLRVSAPVSSSLSQLAMASNPPVLPAPPPLNFGQFSRPVADAKALLRMAAFGRRAWLNDLRLNPKGVAPEVIVSDLNWTDSNRGLAHQHLQMSPPIREELPCLPPVLGGAAAVHDSLSASYPEKTRNESAVHSSPAEIEPDVNDEKCSLCHNTGSSLKRARVPELHKKSEKRQRDTIKEKMRALQKLIPNAGKMDKSSILDEAIEYLKYLQFQIQFRSMQNGMDPRPLMLLTGMQEPKSYHQWPYLQQMGMSTGLMGMDMGMGFGTSIGLPLSHTGTMQTIPGQRVPSSQQLHPNSSLINTTNGSDGIQYLGDNTIYDTLSTN